MENNFRDRIIVNRLMKAILKMICLHNAAGDNSIYTDAIFCDGELITLRKLSANATNLLTLSMEKHNDLFYFRWRCRNSFQAYLEIKWINLSRTAYIKDGEAIIFRSDIPTNSEDHYDFLQGDKNEK